MLLRKKWFGLFVLISIAFYLETGGRVLRTYKTGSVTC